MNETVSIITLRLTEHSTCSAHYTARVPLVVLFRLLHTYVCTSWSSWSPWPVVITTTTTLRQRNTTQLIRASNETNINVGGTTRTRLVCLDGLLLSMLMDTTRCGRYGRCAHRNSRHMFYYFGTCLFLSLSFCPNDQYHGTPCVIAHDSCHNS